MFICKQKTNLILSIFLVILQRYCKFVILIILGKPAYTHPKLYQHPVENFRIYLQAKKQLHPPFLSRDIAKISKFPILGTLGMPGCAHPYDNINLQKILLFLSIPKTNFFIHFFLEILHFKESCSLIGQQQHFGS